MIALKSSLQRVLPLKTYKLFFRAFDRVRTAFEFLGDAAFYLRYSGPADAGLGGRLSSVNRDAQISKEYHRIEKGLTLPHPRRPFGSSIVARINIAKSGATVSSDIQEYANTALEALEKWNSSGEISTSIAPLLEEQVDSSVPQNTAFHFFSSRHSVRNFSTEKIPSAEEVANAYELAQFTPSVCNRQAWRVHLYTDKSLVQKILELQAGNTGFGDTVSVVAVVSIEAGSFMGSSERYQMWIDGGLFTMSFVYALHALGIDSCLLNWSSRNSRTRRLRRLAHIPSSESVICAVAIGYAADRARLARSPRRARSRIVTMH